MLQWLFNGFKDTVPTLHRLFDGFKNTLRMLQWVWKGVEIALPERKRRADALAKVLPPRSHAQISHYHSSDARAFGSQVDRCPGKAEARYLAADG